MLLAVLHPISVYIIFSRSTYISYRFLSSLRLAGVFVFGGGIWHFRILGWGGLAGAQRIMLAAWHRWPLRHVSDILQAEEAFTVEEYKHTNTHTHTHTHTMFVSNNRASFHLWRKEKLVKHQNVSRYFENDCLQNFLLLFMSLLTAPIVESSHI